MTERGWSAVGEDDCEDNKTNNIIVNSIGVLTNCYKVYEMFDDRSSLEGIWGAYYNWRGNCRNRVGKTIRKGFTNIPMCYQYS